jgi:hypothetical protein
MRKSSLAQGLLIACLLTLVTVPLKSQDSSSLFNRILSFPDKVFGRIDKEANKYEQKLTQQTDKYLNKLQRQEEKLKRKLWRQDSVKAKEVFGDVQARYDRIRNSVNEPTAPAIYNGRLDSLGTAINFLQSNTQFQQAAQLKEQFRTNQQSIADLKTKLNQTEQIRKQITHRQQELKQQLQNTPLAKEFRKFKKEVYYYQAQVKEYQDALKDPKKLGGKLLQAANKIPAFQEFMQKHSYLASMFRMPTPTDPGYAANLAGLQTRAQMSNIIQQQIGGGGPNAQQQFQQQIQTAQAEIQNLKNRILPQGGSSDEQMPDFKPNNQKTKSFLDRIEWGSNMQTSKGNLYFPVTSDIGVSAGYKINDKSIIGIGASYKIGLGQNWQNINITHQGAGLRTFLDIKLKGSFWISGGGELNYRNEFRRIDVLKNMNAWQQSALLGISKKYNVGKKWKGNAQLLYDFLWKQQIPRTQAVVFRVGYNF